VAAELWSTRLRVASSILCYSEGRAALAGAHRADLLAADAYGWAREEFESLQGELLLVGIDGPLARQAGELAEALSLPGSDAVHLASALSLGTDTTLVTWGEDLRRAAAESGCSVAPGLRSA
jgi:predicted nucleic acid-binding protein